MKIAITGGIGAGKSYLCDQLRLHYGIVVYDCDAAAKRLMLESAELQARLTQLLGEPVVKDGCYQKALVSNFLLESTENLKRLNEIVHPEVAKDFAASGADWLESAILFDSGFIDRIYINKVICVTAPEEVRVQRIVCRNNVSPEIAKRWINRQWTQEEVLVRSDYEIVNDGQANIEEQIEQLLSWLNSSAALSPSINRLK